MEADGADVSRAYSAVQPRSALVGGSAKSLASDGGVVRAVHLRTECAEWVEHVVGRPKRGLASVRNLVGRMANGLVLTKKRLVNS